MLCLSLRSITYCVQYIVMYYVFMPGSLLYFVTNEQEIFIKLQA